MKIQSVLLSTTVGRIVLELSVVNCRQLRLAADAYESDRAKQKGQGLKSHSKNYNKRFA